MTEATTIRDARTIAQLQALTVMQSRIYDGVYSILGERDRESAAVTSLIHMIAGAIANPELVQPLIDATLPGWSTAHAKDWADSFQRYTEDFIKHRQAMH